MAEKKYLDYDHLQYLVTKIKGQFATQSSIPTKTSDLTNDSNFVSDSSYVHTDANYTTDEKAKLLTIEQGATKTTVDASLDATSSNAIANKAVKSALDGKVDAVTGKGLSTNDLTDDLKKSYDDAVTKVGELTTQGGEPNKIEVIQRNGTALTITNKTVNVEVPTNTSELTNGAGFVTETDVKGYGYQTADQVNTAVADAVGKITSFSASVVEKLPDTGANGVIYLVAHTHDDSDDSYDEYLWISSTSKFEKVGNTDKDLSNYVQSSDLVEITNTEIDAMFTDSTAS